MRKHSGPDFADIVNKLIDENGEVSSADVARAAGTTRQAVHRRLSLLVRQGILQAEGRGRATRYRRARRAQEWRFSLPGLAEDQAWAEVRAALPVLDRPDAGNAQHVLSYAVTEMINNAIDHSGSPEVTVRAELHDDSLRLEIDDDGIGVFERVRRGLALPDALSALQELSKGKVTTSPEHHTGEGVFFTSKMVEAFELEANGLRWIVDNRRGDHAIATAETGAGTIVRLEVDLHTQIRPEELFARYTKDLVFDATRVVVKLFELGVRFVSRSEAKRVVAGLERFREVILDFRGVEAVGQGFVDEVFRVWARQHPEVRLLAENMAPPVAFMVERGRRA